MRKHACLALLVLLPTALAGAQTRIEVVPQSCLGREGDSRLWPPFAVGPGRVQTIVDPSLLQGLGPGATVGAVTFRADGFTGGESKDVELELILSTAARSAAGPSLEYGVNRGADAVVVLPRTRVVLPPQVVLLPAPSKVFVPLRFARPFAWQGGGLCLELVNHTAAPEPWDVDAQGAPQAGAGSTAYAGFSCPRFDTHPIKVAPVPWPGSPLPLDFSAGGTSSHTTAAAVLLLGSGATSWAGLTLPWSMDAALGTTNCSLYTDVLFALSGTLAAGGATADLGPLPAAPGLAGLSLTAQWLILDSRHPGGLGASNLARVTLGRPGPMCTLYNARNGATRTRADNLFGLMPVMGLEVR